MEKYTNFFSILSGKQNTTIKTSRCVALIINQNLNHIFFHIYIIFGDLQAESYIATAEITNLPNTWSGKVVM